MLPWPETTPVKGERLREELKGDGGRAGAACSCTYISKILPDLLIVVRSEAWQSVTPYFTP